MVVDRRIDEAQQVFFPFLECNFESLAGRRVIEVRVHAID